MSTARGSDALASLWRSSGSAAFAWQAWDNLHCQGVGCTPWRPFGVPWAPLLLRGRRGTISIARRGTIYLSICLSNLSNLSNLSSLSTYLSIYLTNLI